MINKRNRKLRAKTKFLDGKTFVHPVISYKMSDSRRRWINRVNDFVRRGMTFKEISKVMDISETTVGIYYYGMAVNCLSPNQLEELKQIPGSTVTWTKIISRIADAGETPDRTNVLMPVYTNVTIREFEEDKLTNTQPIPFEIVKTQYIPRSPSSNFGKGNNERESWEYVDVVDSERTTTKLKPYVVIYSHAACSI